jgi:hypothetical protein
MCVDVCHWCASGWRRCASRGAPSLGPVSALRWPASSSAERPPHSSGRAERERAGEAAVATEGVGDDGGDWSDAEAVCADLCATARRRLRRVHRRSATSERRETRVREERAVSATATGAIAVAFDATLFAFRTVLCAVAGTKELTDSVRVHQSVSAHHTSCSRSH